MELNDKINKTMSDKIILGYWISEKKLKKFCWSEMETLCQKEGIVLKQIDISTNLESQGPFDVFLHKLTDILSHAENNDEQAKEIIIRVKSYIKLHPELIVIDPLENVRNLRCRFNTYEIIKRAISSDDLFVPNFVVFDNVDVHQMSNLLEENKIKFPIVCKPLIAHGSSDAHKMMVIFNEQSLKDCQLPCVAQELINHNAILHKIFCVDDKFHVVERRSLKNFYQKDCKTMETIYFISRDISNRGSQSKWSIISEDEERFTISAKHEVLEQIVKKMRKAFGLTLIGIDVVIENHTGRYGIIDVNVFPAYEGYPNFLEDLVKVIKKMVREKSLRKG